MSKFNFKQIGGAMKYRPWKLWESGDYIIAEVKGTYTDKFKNECYKVQVLECDFKQEDDNFSEGQMVGLNSAGGLNYALSEVPDGAVVRIEYTGKDILQNGAYEGSEVHTFKVGVDDSQLDAQEVKRVQDVKANESTEEDSEEGDNYDL